MSNKINSLKGYKKRSLYFVARTAGEQRKNLGFDYSKVILNKTTSKHLNRNETAFTFMSFLNDYFLNLINAVKWIQIHRVYTVDKKYKNIN